MRSSAGYLSIVLRGVLASCVVGCADDVGEAIASAQRDASSAVADTTRSEGPGRDAGAVPAPTEQGRDASTGDPVRPAFPEPSLEPEPLDASTPSRADAAAGDAAASDAAVAVEVPCQPASCAELGAECGTTSNGCSGQLDCGSCPEGFLCGIRTVNTCSSVEEFCTPLTQEQACAGIECGSEGDGCGAVYDCGTCPEGQLCGNQRASRCDAI